MHIYLPCASTLVNIAIFILNSTLITSAILADTPNKNFGAILNTEKIQFNRDIRPILSDNCFSCHGNDKTNRKSDLTFSNREDAIKTRKDGITAIVPGDASSSEIFKRITHQNPADRMPPKSIGKTLSSRQIKLVKRWINQGATYEKHWSYNVPKKADIPNNSEIWAKNPIDNFIARKHQELNLSRSEEADKRTLIRRVSLDLTGLPPSVEEVNNFLEDSSDNAYEKVVERLLASPHYGEHMATDWLDVVRYADTWGYHSDSERVVWPYRDYIIDSFNDNVPFSTFTKEQLAGDLMPETGYRGLTASTYNMMVKMTQEGGAQDKEYLVKSMVDRITNVGTTWLGSTTGCAVCHDHKFDPYSAKDIYSLGAFFADINEKGKWSNSSRLGINIIDKYPIAFVGPEKERKKYFELLKKHKKAIESSHYNPLKKIKTNKDENSKPVKGAPSLPAINIKKPLSGFDQWLNKVSSLLRDGESAWRSMNIDKLEVTNGNANIMNGKSIITSWEVPNDPSQYMITGTGDFPSTITAIQLDFLSTDEDKASNEKPRKQYLSIRSASVLVKHKDGTQEKSDIDYHALAQSPKPVDFSLYHNTIAQLRPQKIYKPLVGRRKELMEKDLVLQLQKPLSWQSGDKMLIELNLAWRFGVTNIDPGVLPSTRINVTSLKNLGPVPEYIITLAKKPKTTRNESENQQLKKYYHLYSSQALKKIRAVNDSEYAILDYVNQATRTWVTKTKNKPSVTRILNRGDWMDETGEIVTPAIPEFLGRLSTNGRRANRLDLANWLISKDNPLTARVTINRFWKKFYAIGLSKVLDDFGSQGEWPTHPELLDWLAVEFIDSGWDVKHMVRLMVTSSTYRQTSMVNVKQRSQDPYNRYYTRQAQVRLPAEAVRDNVLAIADLLNKTVGGKSVRPYQPRGYLSDLEFPKRDWFNETDNQQYRRGIYTFWQRSRLHPMMKTFDAPSRNEGQANRISSNTPLQALVLLNDPTFVEAARYFAQNIMAKTGDVKSKINWAFEKALARPATNHQEISILVQAYHRNIDYFMENYNEADKLLAQGHVALLPGINKVELAAWTSVARIIFNLHETVTRF